MKQIIAAVALTLFCAGLAAAADNTVVVLPAKNGTSASLTKSTRI